MAWVEQISEENAEGELARTYRAARQRSDGEIANVLRVISLRPKLLSAFMGMYVQLMQSESTLPRLERELVATVTSRTNDCHY